MPSFGFEACPRRFIRTSRVLCGFRLHHSNAREEGRHFTQMYPQSQKATRFTREKKPSLHRQLTFCRRVSKWQPTKVKNWRDGKIRRKEECTCKEIYATHEARPSATLVSLTLILIFPFLADYFPDFARHFFGSIQYVRFAANLSLMRICVVKEA